SRRHAQLAWNNGTWSITKLSLQNTLLVNDRDTPQGELHDRDIVKLGATTSFRFQISNSAPKFFQDRVQPAPVSPKGPAAPPDHFARPPQGLASPVSTVEAQLPGRGQPPIQDI